MEKIRGKIEGVSSKTGASEKGAWERWEFIIDSKKYSTFESVIGKGFTIGDYVEMEGVRNGQYFNMKSMKKVEEGAEAPTQTEHVPVVKIGHSDNQLKITRMNAIGHAIEVVKASDEGLTVENVLEAAEGFVKYVYK